MNKDIIKDLKPRGPHQYKELQRTANLIKNQLSNYTVQPYFYRGDVYENIIVHIDNHKEETIVIGAHYDSCGMSPGVNDNFSSCVLLMDIIPDIPKNYNYEIVFFALEEPPIFGWEFMGSMKYCNDLWVPIKMGIVLDMIGTRHIECFGKKNSVEAVKTNVLPKMELHENHYMTFCDCLAFDAYGHKTIIITGIDEKKGVGPDYHNPRDNHLDWGIMEDNRKLFLDFLKDYS